MAKSLQELLLTASDFDLSCGVAELLWERYRDDLDAMPAEGKVVFWSLSAEGIIGNGGFQYLFERWSLPSAYAEAVAGFRAIGADECADALAEVLEWFPKGVPPADRDRRLRRWRRRPGWPGEYPIADRFRQGSERVPALLATYIRARRQAFERMLSPPKPTPDHPEAEPLDVAIRGIESICNDLDREE